MNLPSSSGCGVMGRFGIREWAVLETGREPTDSSCFGPGFLFTVSKSLQ